MRTHLLTLLHVVTAVQATRRAERIICGHEYQLSNDDEVTLYQQEATTLAISTHANASTPVTWNINFPKHLSKKQVVLKRHFSKNGPGQLIIRDFNATVNGTILFYTSQDKSYTSGKATLLIGASPVIDIYNNSMATGNVSSASNVSHPRSVCLSVRGLPYPTLSVHCDGVAIGAERERNGVRCFRAACEKSMHIVAENCFGKDTVERSDAGKTSIGTDRGVSIATTFSQTASFTERPSVTTTYNPDGVTSTTPSLPRDHVPWLTPVVILVCVLLVLTVIVFLVVCLLLLQHKLKRGRYSIRSSTNKEESQNCRKVPSDWQSSSNTTECNYENPYPYIVTAGSSIIATTTESSRNGYLEPAKFISLRKEETMT